MSPRLGVVELIIVLACLVAFIAIVAALVALLLRSRPTASQAGGRREEGVPEVMTIDEVAALLRVDANIVEELIQDGRLPAVKVGEDWRISRINVIAYINTGGGAGEEEG